MKRWPRDQREKNGIFQRPAGKNRLKKKKKKKKKICVSSFSVRSPSWSRGSASTPLKTFFSYECHQSAVSTARPRPLASTLGRSFVRRWAPVINTVAKFTLTGLILRHDSAVHPQVHFFSSPPSQCLRSFLFFLFFLSLSIPPPTVVASRFFEEDDRTVFPFPFFFFPIFFVVLSALNIGWPTLLSRRDTKKIETSPSDFDLGARVPEEIEEEEEGK